MDRGPISVKGVTEKIAMVHGRIDVHYPATSDDMKLDFEGVHFLANGSIYCWDHTLWTIIYSPHQLFRCPDICIPRYALISILGALQGELGSGTLIYSYSYSKSHSRPVSNAQHLISAARAPPAQFSRLSRGWQS
ncbi:hypothetical protein EDD22DRAFT_1011535 [Suillus occidentalis]|nr:hypothetical protein EDD22DRAFT_1011535 [Suillus occidentalis]